MVGILWEWRLIRRQQSSRLCRSLVTVSWSFPDRAVFYAFDGVSLVTGLQISTLIPVHHHNFSWSVLPYHNDAAKHNLLLQLDPRTLDHDGFVKTTVTHHGIQFSGTGFILSRANDDCAIIIYNRPGSASVALVLRHSSFQRPANGVPGKLVRTTSDMLKPARVETLDKTCRIPKHDVFLCTRSFSIIQTRSPSQYYSRYLFTSTIIRPRIYRHDWYH